MALLSTGILAIGAAWQRRKGGGGAAAVQWCAVAGSGIAALLEPRNPSWLPAAFYIGTGSVATLLLSHFWVHALDSWDARRARVVFPALAGAGLAGAMVGGALASALAPRVGTAGLLWLLAGWFLAARLVTRAVERAQPKPRSGATREADDSALAIAAHTPFVRWLALALTLAIVVGTLVDFQFKVYAQREFPSMVGITGFLGAFHSISSALALVAQFGLAGWILKRTNLATAAGLQPAAIALCALTLVLAPLWWVALAMRWAQGILFQTLGKSSSEIFFLAVRPAERRRVKPVLDTLVERWGDAIAGLLVVVGMHGLGMNLHALAWLTILLSTGWLAVLARLRLLAVFPGEDALAWPLREVPGANAGSARLEGKGV